MGAKTNGFQPKKHSTPSTLFQTRSAPWSRCIAAEVFAFQTGLFPTYQVRMIPMASPSRALSRLGVRGRAFKNAALPFKPFQDSSFDFGAVVNEELVEPEVPEVFPWHSQGIVCMTPSSPACSLPHPQVLTLPFQLQKACPPWVPTSIYHLATFSKSLISQHRT